MGCRAFCFLIMTDAIIVRKVKKLYGEVQAVDGISFDVHEGECFGLLGPNGAGKTSTMAMVRCFSDLDAGQMKVLGYDVHRHARKIRSRLGVVPQDDSLDQDLTVLDNLLIYAAYFGISQKSARERADELLRFMTLEDKASVRIEQLSGGMRKRLLIARALINSPQLLILDEPTTGLDPQARHHIWQRLMSLKAAGTTMLLCTHYMDEAQQLCDRLAIMDKGTILAQGTPRELVSTHAGGIAIKIQGSVSMSGHDLLALYEDSLPDKARIEYHGSSLFFFLLPGQPIPHGMVEATGKLGLELSTRPATLEDVFLNLTGRELRE